MQSKFEFFGNSTETWFRAFHLLWESEPWAEVAARYFSSICPIPYEKLVAEYDSHSVKVVESILKTHKPNFHDRQRISHSLKEFKAMLSLYAPSAGYSVSLSRCSDEMLMWSHYAKGHSGYCLIYRPINGFLNQCPTRVKDSLSVSQGHITTVDTKFKVEAIEYENGLVAIDAFKLLPGRYTGYKPNTEEERLEFHENVKKQLLTKNEDWAYEKECRLMLPQPREYISGNSTHSNYQRLFNYDFNQVAGIVFGAHIDKHEKSVIKEIINGKLEKRARGLGRNGTKIHVFDFMYQQAEICSSARAVRIIDQEIISMDSKLEAGSEHYKRQLAYWKAFKGITFEFGKSSYEAIP